MIFSLLSQAASARILAASFSHRATVDDLQKFASALEADSAELERDLRVRRRPRWRRPRQA